MTEEKACWPEDKFPALVGGDSKSEKIGRESFELPALFTWDKWEERIFVPMLIYLVLALQTV